MYHLSRIYHLRKQINGLHELTRYVTSNVVQLRKGPMKQGHKTIEKIQQSHCDLDTIANFEGVQLPI